MLGTAFYDDAWDSAVGMSSVSAVHASECQVNTDHDNSIIVAAGPCFAYCVNGTLQWGCANC